MTARVTMFVIASMMGPAIAAGGQNIPGNPSRPGNPVKSEAIKVSDEIKATGCLTKNTAGIFQLKSPTLETNPWYSPAGAKAVGAPSPIESNTTFELRNGTGLDAHLGHRIEVTGTLEPGSANTPPTPDTIGGPGGTVGVPPHSVPRLDFPKLNVKSMKMVAARCP